MSQGSESSVAFRYSRRTAAYDSTMVRLADAGNLLGRVAVEEFVADVREFAEAVHGGSALRQFVVMSTHSQQHNRRMMLFDVDAVDLNTEARPRWYWQVMEHSFGLYCMFRRRAAPRMRQPVHTEGLTLHVPRELHRRLQVRGLHSGAVHSMAEMRLRATERLQRRWAAMQGRQLVLWLDNFVRPRYSHNPILSGQLTLNATALAVLPLSVNLPDPPGLVPVAELNAYRRASSIAVEAYQFEFTEMWRCVLETDLSLDDFRVPLDVMRPPQRRVHWLPFGVSGCSVQSNANLVDLLQMALDVRRHSGRPMPLLLDLDIWYRLVKLSYAANAVRWNVTYLLRQLPPLYGVWHPYKYVLTMVYRQFHSHFVFLREGTVEDGFSCGSKVDVRAAELFMAALLVVPRSERLALRNTIEILSGMVQRLGERVVRLENLIQRESSALRMGRQQYGRVLQGSLRGEGISASMREDERRRDARLQNFRNDLATVLDLLQRKKDERNRLVALVFLLEQYAPACLALGVLVRDCSWEHRTMDTGLNAKKVIMAALCVLVHLVEKEHTLEYVRTLCTALVCWRSWNNAVPGMAYSEERCEALLSRLGRRCNQYPRSVSASEVEDLFLALISPSGSEPVQLRSHKPTSDLVNAVRNNLRQVISSGGSVIRYVPWSSDRILRVEAAWPEDYRFPEDLEEPLTQRHLNDLFEYELRVMLRSDLVIGTELGAKLEATAVLRSDADADARLQRLRVAMDSLEVPRRYRRSTQQI